MEEYRLCGGVLTVSADSRNVVVRLRLFIFSETRLPLSAASCVTAARVPLLPGRFLRIRTAGGSLFLPFAPSSFSEALCRAVRGEGDLR